ncbi:MAG: ribonuclease P protein component [bacterium]
MLPKKNRILKDKEFSYLYRKGKFVSCGCIMMKYLPTTKDAPSRFGIVISTKVSKKSTIRNKIKRQIRDVLKKNFSKFSTGYDAVIMTNQNILEKSYTEIEEALNKLFAKAKFI